jgi:hypothetical protein
MGEFSHSNPYTGETFGDEMVFERGPAVAADGGRADAQQDEEDEQTMGDVDHEHPHDDAEDANRVFTRGQGRSDGDGDDEQADSV